MAHVELKKSFRKNVTQKTFFSFDSHIFISHFITMTVQCMKIHDTMKSTSIKMSASLN